MLGAVLIGLLVMPAAAQAQSDNATAAEALFEQGRALMKQKRYTEACEKFEASHKLDPSVGALLNLGDCRQKNGQTASAWTQLRQAIALARQNGDRRREQLARQRAEALEAQLSYLLVEVPEPARLPGLVVTRNGVAVDQVLWGQPLPVDPGVHTMEVTAPGHEPQEIRVEVPARPGETRASVPALAPKAEDPEVPDPSDRGPGTDDGEPGVAPARDAGMPLGRKIALAGAAVAVVGVATGTVFGLQARSRWGDAEDLCGDMPDDCTPEGVALSKDAASAGNLSTLSFSLGLAAATAGAILWFVSAPDEHASDAAGESATRIAPMVSPDTLGASIHLRF
jgi:tetratricopeptide (TPR) repeat protein